MGREDILYNGFLKNLGIDPTACQDAAFRKIAGFVTSSDSDIMVLSGFAGTGKTTLLAAVVNTLTQFGTPCTLLAPTGRAAKVLSGFAGRQAYTIHKHIYRQKSFSDDGMGLFSLSHNKSARTLFVVDEVSLIGTSQEGGSPFGSGNLLDDLIQFVRAGAECKLLLVGDKAQLPPVGLDESPALDATIEGYGGIVRAEMKTIVRQKAESGILLNATRLRNLLFEDGVSMMSRSDLRFETRGFDDVVRIGGGEVLEALTDAYSHYGEDETMIVCRSNKMSNRYNQGIRSMIQYKEDRLVRGDRLMIVKNSYLVEGKWEETDYIANGDVAELQKISSYEERYGLEFATARLSFPDYNDNVLEAKICLDTLTSDSPSLSYEKQNTLYQGVSEDYAHIKSKRKRYDAVKMDPYYSALQIKYGYAATCHKAQGGQWKCVFIDNPIWQEELDRDMLRWLYTAITRATEKVYLVNFNDDCFIK